MTKRARNTLLGSLLMAAFSVGSYMLMTLYVVPLSETLNVSSGNLIGQGQGWRSTGS
jgi:hypothetical protein